MKLKLPDFGTCFLIDSGLMLHHFCIFYSIDTTALHSAIIQVYKKRSTSPQIDCTWRLSNQDSLQPWLEDTILI